MFPLCKLILPFSAIFVILQDKNYEELKAVVSSYSFHGQAEPKLLTENGKSKPEALVTKCKISLCLPCFKSSANSKPSETKSEGSHVSLPYSSGGSHVIEMNNVTQESSAVTDKNENLHSEKTSNGNDMQLRLTPIISAPSHSQPHRTSLANDSSSDTAGISNARFLEVKPSWTRTLAVISEQESPDPDNHSVNANDCNVIKKVKFPGISPVSSPVPSPQESVGWEPQGKDAKHRKEQLSRRKTIRDRISKLTMDPLFDMFITFCILVNTVFLALEYHGMNEQFRLALDVGNMVGTNK